MLGAVQDYPRTLAEMEEWFATDEACQSYLVKLRWADGIRCARCHSCAHWETKRGLTMCGGCGYQQSVTAGTIFHRSHLPLRLWFRVMWAVTAPKSGVSALGLQRLLGLGSYETAWMMLQKLRRAMVRPGRDQLSGEVEVDETLVGGVEKGGGRRHLGNKALVVVAAEVDGRGIGRIRMKRIPDSSAESLLPFVQGAVRPGTVVVTDGWPSYAGLPEAHFWHRVHVRGTNPERASKLLPRVHRVASLLKRWLLGTHQGGVSRQQLDYYLDEFTFRFNRRTSRHRGKLFYRLAQQAVAIEPSPYSDLVASRRNHYI